MLPRSPLGGMEDAGDLKSSGHWPCWFEPSSGHNNILDSGYPKPRQDRPAGAKVAALEERMNTKQAEYKAGIARLAEAWPSATCA